MHEIIMKLINTGSSLPLKFIDNICSIVYMYIAKYKYGVYNIFVATVFIWFQILTLNVSIHRWDERIPAITKKYKGMQF